MYFIVVLLFLFTVGNCSDSDDIVACTNVWTSVANSYDTALNADSDTTTLTSSLNALGNQLTSDVYWSTPYTTLPASGKSNVINNIKNVEAPSVTNSTRISGTPRVISQTLIKLQASFLVQHSFVTNGNRVNQVERVTVSFRRVLLAWNIESLSVLVVRDSKDDLIQEIISLKMENQRLAAAYGGYVAEDALSESHYQTIKSIYDHVVYPNQIPIVASGFLPGAFSDTVHGRIHPVGVFKDYEGTIEYFYGLSPVAGNTRIVAANLVHFVSKANIAASEVIFTFADPNNGTVQANMTQKGFWRFDDDGLVAEFDLEILDLELRAISLGQDSRNPAWRNEIINTVCYTQHQVCTGNNTQFATLQDCFTFMNSIDFGTADRYWSNSVQCRSIHLILAAIRPAYHCPHVGPSGGGKCIDLNYNSLYVPLYDSPPRLIN